MSYGNNLKELLKLILKVKVGDEAQKQNIINKLELYMSSYNDAIKNYKIASSTKVNNQESSQILDKSLIDKVNAELLNLFNSPKIPDLFYMEAVKYLAPIIGTTRFFTSWWPKLLSKWLIEDLEGDESFLLKIIVEFLLNDGDFNIKNDPKNGPSGILYILEYYAVNHRGYSLEEKRLIYLPDEPLSSLTQSSNLLNDTSLYLNLNRILLDYGIKKPKEFYSACDILYRYSRYRLPITDLILNFVSEKSDYTHEILESNLLNNIYKSLILDNSWMAFQLNLTVLSMVLPYVTKELPPALPIVFLITLRYWISLSGKLANLFGDKNLDTLKEAEFEILEDISESDDNKRIKNLFSMMLLLFPCNFIEFLKSPITYLNVDLEKCAFCIPSEFIGNLDLSKAFNEKAFKFYTNEILKEHTFPSNFIYGDKVHEISSESTTLLMEPMEIISRSISLQSQLSTNSKAQVNGNTDIDPLDSFSEQFIKLKSEIMSKYKDIGVGHEEGESTSNIKNYAKKGYISIINENILLQSELLYESYLCEQQCLYIRRLHRDRVLESSTESERHSLYSTCKALRNEVKILKELMERQRIESSASQSKHITWENELNKKVKYYRELSRDLKQNNEQLALELRELKEKYKTDQAMVQSLQAKVSSLQTVMESLDNLNKQLLEKDMEIQKLSEKIIHWEIDSKKSLKEAQNENPIDELKEP